MSHRWDPRRGRWTLLRNIRAYLEEAAGPVTEEDLLHHLKVLGYYVPSMRRVLRSLVVINDHGHMSLR